jgi:hypothetical protein
MVDRPNSATAIAGGEGKGAWEHHHVGAHLGRSGSGWGGMMEAVWPAAEVNGGGGAPAAGGGKEVVGELQGGVGKLGVESIGVEVGRRGVFHDEQKAVVGGDCWHRTN